MSGGDRRVGGEGTATPLLLNYRRTPVSVSEGELHQRLCSESVLLIRREDVLQRLTPDLGLSAFLDPRWETLDVEGKGCESDAHLLLFLLTDASTPSHPQAKFGRCAQKRKRVSTRRRTSQSLRPIARASRSLPSESQTWVGSYSRPQRSHCCEWWASANQFDILFIYVNKFCLFNNNKNLDSFPSVSSLLWFVLDFVGFL